MSKPIVCVRNLRKSYNVYSHPAQMIREVFTGRTHHREFVALDDISFDVHPGSVVGLLGRNGAGKSTLLRIIAHTLDATGGTVTTDGRISAILELGTGFHLDYTGRENIYFGGVCLGLSRREMHERIDEIIAFSELEDFIDQPFRTYSSGMQARLTFSVATCVDPDILIVDEALAVGDAKFQLKSFDRIREFKRRGKAILLVSHSLNQVAAFCDHAILLDHGRMLAQGDPNRVGNIYHEMLFGPANAAATILPPVGTTAGASGTDGSSPATEISKTSSAELDGPWQPEGAPETADRGSTAASADNGSVAALPADSAAPERETFVLSRSSAAAELPQSSREHRYGNGDAKIIAFEIRDSGGRVPTRLRSLETYDLLWKIRVYHAISDLCYGILLRDARGLDVFGADSYHLSGMRLGPQIPGTEIRALTRFRANIAGGVYFLTLALANPDQTKYDLRFDAVELHVEPTPGIHTSSLVNLEVEFELDGLSCPPAVPLSGDVPEDDHYHADQTA